MDKAQIEKIGKACFVASCKGYVGTFDEHNNLIRQVLTAPDGHRVSGSFKPNKAEAIESCILEFLKYPHDTSAGNSNR